MAESLKRKIQNLKRFGIENSEDLIKALENQTELEMQISLEE